VTLPQGGQLTSRTLFNTIDSILLMQKKTHTHTHTHTHKSHTHKTIRCSLFRCLMIPVFRYSLFSVCVSCVCVCVKSVWNFVLCGPSLCGVLYWLFIVGVGSRAICHKAEWRSCVYIHIVCRVFAQGCRELVVGGNIRLWTGVKL
jgi:hypothetical protein